MDVGEHRGARRHGDGVGDTGADIYSEQKSRLTRVTGGEDVAICSLDTVLLGYPEARSPFFVLFADVESSACDTRLDAQKNTKTPH